MVSAQMEQMAAVRMRVLTLILETHQARVLANQVEAGGAQVR